MKLNTKSLLEALSIKHKKIKQSALGLDFNHSNLFALELEKAGNRYTVTRFLAEPIRAAPHEGIEAAGTRTVPPWDPSNPSGQALLALLAREKFTSGHINIALSGPAVLTRFIQFPKMVLKDLKAAMRYEIEKYIPFEGNDVISDFHILAGEPQNKKTMKVILVAAKRTEVFSLIESFHKLNVKIHLIDIHTFACLNAFSHSHLESEKGTTVLLDIGLETASLLVLVDKEPAFIREISMGSNDLIDSFKKKLGWPEETPQTFSFESEIASHLDLFTEGIEPLVSQIRLSLNYFIHNNPKAETPKLLFLSGELCHLRHFQDQLKGMLELEPTLWDPLKGIEISPGVAKESLDRFRYMLPVSVGLALRME